MQYLPMTDQDLKDMMDVVKIPSLDALFNVIPQEFRLQELLNLPNSLSEKTLTKHMNQLAKHNTDPDSFTSFIGEISYRHYIPAIVKTLSSLPQFYTAYTPYQPEVSQGTLQAIYEFQSLMTNLTEMDLTNASMYDGATSTAEAMIMVCQHQRKNKVLISTLLHPYLTEVLKTYAEMRQIELIPVSADEGSISYPELERLAKEDPAMLIIQSPNVFGIIEELEPVCTMLKARKIATLAAVLEPLSLAIIKTPGACGVDVTTGEAQSFGIAPSYGGPGLGFFSTRKEYIRKIPGRIVGKTTDEQQRTAYVMTLRAREQDIRREKASSNICTNHALCALQATIYLSTLGEIGLKKLAQRNLQLSHKAFEALLGIPGIRAPFKKPFFNEFLIEIDQDLQKVKETSIKHKILLSKTDLSKTFPYLKNPILLNLTELNSEQDIEKLVEAFKEALK